MIGGSFIVTASGQEYDLARPLYARVTAMDVAHSLSQINRFTGHARRPYSVAEHSLLVCEIAQRIYELDVYGLLAALMHDAHEAYTNDLASPAKGVVGVPWHRFETMHYYTVQNAFALTSISSNFSAVVRRCDLMALATERRDLLPPTPTPWPILQGVEAVAWIDLNSPERQAATWLDWRHRFHARLEELDFARNQALMGCTRHAPSSTDAATTTEEITAP